MIHTTDSERAARLLARLERVPFSRWHLKACLIMGIATFFDAFDVLAIAYVLPVLVEQWSLAPSEIGLLISASFVGQIVGAIFFGALAERIGRRRTVVFAIALFSVMAVFSAFSWNLLSLLIFRTIQGIGLGGEVPVAATYINEILRAKGRGRFFLLYQLIFPAGLVGAALTGFWLVPKLGWQVMFLIGSAPAILALVALRVLPESPRWLVSKGRIEEAEAVIESAEESASRGGTIRLPAPSGLPSLAGVPVHGSWAELFRGIYRRRTFIVWALWICTYFVSYGITTWLPTLYRTVYKLSVSMALGYALATTIAGLIGAFLCAMAVDRFGRKSWFIAAFLMGSLPLFTLWWLGAETSLQVLVLASIGFLFIASNSMLVYLYTPEIYPTRLRSLGTGAASAWLRIASAAGPLVVGPILSTYGISGVFLLFGVISLAGVIVSFAVIETRERRLEEISP